MQQDILQRYFFITALFVVGLVVFYVFYPFLEVLLLAVIFAVVLSPLHSKLTKVLFNKSSLSAVVVLILLAAVIITPAFFLGTRILDESKGLYNYLLSPNPVGLLNSFTLAVETPIQKIYPDFSLNANEYLSNGADLLTRHLTGILSGVVTLVISIILMFIAVYFFLKDGPRFKKIVVDLSPLNDKHDLKMWNKVRDTINTTIKGVILVALIQGILAGIGLWIFGIPNATLWGSISAIAALVPGLGTAIVFIPAILYTMFLGNTASAIGLLVWGVVVVGLVDNFLIPYIYSRGILIHPMIMLFAVLGGIIAFGPIGFVFGPIIIALFFSMIDIYEDLILDKSKI